MRTLSEFECSADALQVEVAENVTEEATEEEAEPERKLEEPLAA